MIIFDDLLRRLSEAGWSTYRIKKEKVLSGSTLARIRAGMSVSTDTIDTICRLCGCQPGDLMRYTDQEKEEA